VTEIALEYGKIHQGALTVFEVDTDANPSLTKELLVTSIPTLLLVRKGEVLERVVGVVPKSTLLTLMRNTFRDISIAGTD
jgi:thioredoxin 1